MNIKYRCDVINHLIRKNNYKSYLEIGVFNGINFNHINCKNKLSVDPDFSTPASLHLTSDEFFKINFKKFDLIFIDGLHHFDQVYRDIINSLNSLNENGTIVCHDMNPMTREIQETPRKGNGFWTGDCWKAWLKLRSENENLLMRVVDVDFGCGIISSGKQEKIWLDCPAQDLDYSFLQFNRKYLLNLISVEDFINERYNYPKT